ncbi:MAG: hypothetical protein HQ481_01720 [Alphaproteobacteria bacterium]|nr:hypothetical protein [Alphaproteobacteria bacterium]
MLRAIVALLTRLTAVTALSTLALVVPADANPVTIEIGDRSYVAHVPPDWDGTKPLGVVVFFHGFGQRGMTVMKNKSTLEAFSRANVLVVAPDGQGNADGQRRRWRHQGAPYFERLLDDDTFIETVLADVAARWPIDARRRWASGFSIGGSMAWHMACFRADLFSAFIPVAGAFWRPHPETCPAGPVAIRHTHGTSDTVVPMTGRVIREVYRQGDVREGIAFWRRQNGCAAEPSRIEHAEQLRCEVWADCGSHREVQLCLHDGNHGIPKGWAPAAIAWADRVSLSGD